MYRYNNNAFRILGLKPDVAMKEITKRANEIKVKTSLGMKTEYEYDFPFMGPIQRDEQSVLDALQRLENPILRLEEEIFWFWFETDYDIEAIDCLTQNNLNEAYNIWDYQLKEDNPTEETISAYFNQVVLLHSTLIKEESSDHYTLKTKIRNKKDISLNKSHWEKWQLVIDRFTLLASNNLFWERIEEKAKRIADPRLSKVKIQEIRNNLLNDIIQPNFSFISQALNKKDYPTVKNHVNLFYFSNIPDGLRLPREVMKDGFNKILLSRTNALNECADKAEKKFTNIQKGIENPDNKIEAIIDLYDKCVKEIEAIIYEGTLVDPTNISDFSLAKDRVAELIRMFAVRIFYDLAAAVRIFYDLAASAGSRFALERREESFFKSYTMIRKALKFSCKKYSSERIERDKINIEGYLQRAFGYNKFSHLSDKIQEQEKREEDVTEIYEDNTVDKHTPLVNWRLIALFGIALSLLSLFASLVFPPIEVTHKKKYTIEELFGKGVEFSLIEEEKEEEKEKKYCTPADLGLDPADFTRLEEEKGKDKYYTPDKLGLDLTDIPTINSTEINNSPVVKPPSVPYSSSSNHYSNVRKFEVAIADLEEKLIRKEKIIEEMESTLESIYGKITNLEAQLDDLERKIDSVFSVDEKNKLIDEYNKIFLEYDRLFDSYDDFYEEYEKVFGEYDREIEQYNALVGSYYTNTMPSFITYTVKTGDSLSKIAKDFNTSVEEIAKINRITNANIIRPGQILFIPQ